MKRKINVLTLLFSCSSTLFSFSQINLVRKYVSPIPNFQFTFASSDTATGGYLLLSENYLGECSSNINWGPTVIRTDSTGLPLWSCQYSFCNFVSGYDIRNVPPLQGTLGEILITGGYKTGSGSSYPFVLKLSSSGDVIWAKRFSNALGGNGAIINTKDFGFLTCGTVSSALIITKWDYNGNIQWSKLYRDSSLTTGARHCVQLHDGYIMAGQARPNFSDRPYLLRIDTNGNVLWYRRYILGSAIQDAYSGGLIMTSDSGFVISGTDGAVNKGFLLKVDKMGNFIWAKKYSVPTASWFTQLTITTDNGFIVTGNKDAGSNYFKSFILKTDSVGNPTLGKILLDSMPGAGYRIKRNDYSQYSFSGNYGMHPFNYFKFFIFDTLSNVACSNDSVNCYATSFTPIVITTISQNSINVFTTALTVSKEIFNVSVYDECTGQLLPWQSSTTSIEDGDLQSESGIEIFPNPVVGHLTILSSRIVIKEVEVYDVVGEKCFAPLNPLKGTYARIDVSGLTPGIYFITVTDEEGKRVVRKIVKM